MNQKISLFMLFTLLTLLACNKKNPITHPNDNNNQPDNGQVYKIVFYSDREVPGQYQIYTMDSNQENLLRLTNDASTYLHPQFSPDGTSILLSLIHI